MVLSISTVYLKEWFICKFSTGKYGLRLFFFSLFFLQWLLSLFFFNSFLWQHKEMEFICLLHLLFIYICIALYVYCIIHVFTYTQLSLWVPSNSEHSMILLQSKWFTLYLRYLGYALTFLCDSCHNAMGKLHCFLWKENAFFSLTSSSIARKTSIIVFWLQEQLCYCHFVTM